MKRKFLIICLSLLLVMALLVPAGAGCAPKAEGEKVFKFAAVWALSGFAAYWGYENKWSMEIVEEDINAAGGIKVKGDYYKFQPVYYDHQFDTSIATTLARKAIFEDGIKYMGLWAQGEVMAVQPFSEKGKVIIITDNPGTVYLGPDYYYTFDAFFYYPDSVDVMFEYVKKKYPNYRKMASIYYDNPASHEMEEQWRDLAKEYAYEVVGTSFVPWGATDLYPVLTPFVKANVDILEIGVLSPELTALAVKQARELGFKGLFIDTDAFDYMLTAEGVGWEAMQGMLGAPYPANMTSDAGKRWAERFRQKSGKPALTGWAASFYDAAMLLKLAIEKANTFDTEKVAAAMEEVSFDGVFGPVKWGGKSVIGANRLLEQEIVLSEIQGQQAVDIYKALPRRLRK